MSIHMDKFAKFLTAQMKEHDWTQADLARASGLSRQVISYYLGIAKADVEQAHRRASPVDNMRL